jgi:hypothetical protein
VTKPTRIALPSRRSLTAYRILGCGSTGRSLLSINWTRTFSDAQDAQDNDFHDTLILPEYNHRCKRHTTGSNPRRTNSPARTSSKKIIDAECCRSSGYECAALCLRSESGSTFFTPVALGCGRQDFGRVSSRPKEIVETYFSKGTLSRQNVRSRCGHE